MAWTAPMTAVANSTFTAAQFNTHVRDNLNETAPAKATTAGGYFVATGSNSIAERIIQFDFVTDSQTTTSTSYTDLTTSGPAVTVTTAAKALVWVNARLANNSAGDKASMSHEISGASSSPASDQWSLRYESGNANDEMIASAVVLRDTLTAGSNVFTAKYRAVGAGTATFDDRRLIVMPL